MLDREKTGAELLETEAGLIKSDIERLDETAWSIREQAQDLAHEAHELSEEAHKLEDRGHELEDELRRERHEDERAGHAHGHDEGRDSDHDDHHGNDDAVEITMVVNGQPIVIRATENERLVEVRQRALDETQNIAQPPDNWEIKDEAGVVLDPEKQVGEFHFGKKVTLFLSLKAGVAGATVR